MIKQSFALFIATTTILLACNFTNSSTASTAIPATADLAKTTPVTYGPLDTATFAAGCFWCEEAIFEHLKGVESAVSGFAGGHTKNPTYEEVCTHTTGHTETVQVFYDPTIISYQTLLEVYFGSQDPTQVNGQGPDHGDSYRSVIFYRTEAERTAAENYKQQLNASGKFSADAVLPRPLLLSVPLKRR